jgi:Fe-S-cluster-containing dehydrogenase component
MGYGAVIDVTKCLDCRGCVVSCQDRYALNDYPPYSAAMPFEGQKWVHVETVERGTFPKVRVSNYPVLCMHCDNAPCIGSATGGAVYKRPDGIVIIDPVKSKGQKQIVDACPYGVIFWNAAASIPQKCTLCVQSLESGQVPRCQMACPNGAITIGDYNQIMQAASSAAAPLHPEYKTQNRVLYIGLPMTFITGTTVDSNGECLQGANITLVNTGTKTSPSYATRNTTSDYFGDFWFDGLQANKTYNITVTAAGKTKTLSVTPTTDTNVGDIQLA